MDQTWLPVGDCFNLRRLFVSLNPRILARVLFMEHVAKLWMQIVKLLGDCPAVADFDTLSATELASFSHAEKLVELLVLHFFGMAAVEEDAGVCFATQSYLKGLVASLRSQVLEVTAL